MNVNQPPGRLNLPGMSKYHPKTDMERHEASRLAFLSHIPDTPRKHLVACVGEFVGTFMFLFFAFAATQIANTTPSDSVVSSLLFISLAFGFSLAVNAWIFFRITGGVTLALCLVGALTWARGLIIFVAQIVGAIAASAVVSALFPGPMLVLTSLSSGTSTTRGLFIEMFLTAELIFTILMLAVEKSKATYLAPVGIGLSLFIAELAGVNFTGGSLNPARSFGPAVITGTFDGYHWIYWVGPILGSLVAVGFHSIVKGLEYETVNPGQDLSDKEVLKFRDDEDEPRNKAHSARKSPALRSSHV